MGKLLLTSAGFDNINIGHKFLELIGKPVKEIKVLFIPTAAITEEQKAVVPLCKQDLLDIGILEENIDSYNFEEVMTTQKLTSYHGMYVCGGDPQYLLDRFNEDKLELHTFLDNNGVYVGVSAGSIVMAQNLEKNLDYVNCTLNVHREIGSHEGVIDIVECPNIELTNNQAILINGDMIEVIM